MAPSPIEELALSPAALVAAFLFGALWGSFANVCIYRWPPTDAHPDGRSVVHPGSHCGACGQPVRWYDNVPIASWLWLRGRCRDCGTQFSARYLLVEALTGALFAAAWWFAVDVRAPLEPFDARLVRFAIGAAFAWTMVVILFTDLDHKLVLALPSYPAIPLFYGLGLLLPERRWPDGLIGIVVGYGLVRLIADGYYYLTKREGMGYGDGVILAVVGALLGWRGVVVGLFLGATLGTLIAVPALLVGRRREAEEAAEAAAAEEAAEAEAAEDDGAADDGGGLARTEVPFGPFLAMAALFWWFAEPYVTMRFLGR
ncbi:MAG: prepilin peptidase [Kofleriaceae bacterium]|nr:prepilin peptidase [Kofleriaceae bacterium]MBP9167789.1 prepilin peptidase [Kofleriaceae bacterium]MBP9857714.1 prepilin peptidase [Kofleriaceae bacterium]